MTLCADFEFRTIEKPERPRREERKEPEEPQPIREDPKFEEEETENEQFYDHIDRLMEEKLKEKQPAEFEHDELEANGNFHPPF